jgi:hypothetical protein
MAIEDSLKSFAVRLNKSKVLRRKPMAFKLSGASGGHYFLDWSTGTVRVSKGSPSGEPVVELIGDASRIIAILEGRKDARKQFLAGGFRVRGDLHYVSDLAMDLGILKEPI